MDINLTLIAQAITFALFIAFCVKFIWPPFQRAISERQAMISEGLESAQRAQVDLETAKSHVVDIIKEARDDAARVASDAEKQARAMIEDARLSAKEEAEKEYQLKKSELSQDIERARADLREQVALLAVEGAKQILQKEVDSAKHADILSKLKSKL